METKTILKLCGGLCGILTIGYIAICAIDKDAYKKAAYLSLKHAAFLFFDYSMEEAEKIAKMYLTKNELTNKQLKKLRTVEEAKKALEKFLGMKVEVPSGFIG